VYAEAGVLAGELHLATYAHGLAVPTGQHPGVGIAGLTLGGGFGWLMRKHGLTIDNLLGVELVTADGRVLSAAPDRHPELFWALRGGGGNFGVVTGLTYQAHPISQLVAGGPLIYGIDKAAAALRFLRDFMAAAPDELTVYATLFTAPPAPTFPPHLHGQPALSIDIAYIGAPEDGLRTVEPLRKRTEPDVDRVGPMAFDERQPMRGGGGPSPMHHSVDSTFLRELSDDAIAALLACFQAVTSPKIAAQVVRMGGAVGHVAPDATAFAHRAAGYMLSIPISWMPGEDYERHLLWARRLKAALQPWLSGGAYVNGIGEEGEEVVRATYGHDTYARLQAVKRRYDPANVFRSNQNIKPW